MCGTRRATPTINLESLDGNALLPYLLFRLLHSVLASRVAPVALSRERVRASLRCLRETPRSDSSRTVLTRALNLYLPASKDVASGIVDCNMRHVLSGVAKGWKGDAVVLSSRASACCLILLLAQTSVSTPSAGPNKL